MLEYEKENLHRVFDCVDGIFCWEELIHRDLFVFILLVCQPQQKYNNYTLASSNCS